MASRAAAGAPAVVIVLGGIADGAAAALAERIAGGPPAILRVTAEPADADGAVLAVPGAAIGERLKCGLQAALAMNAGVVAVVDDLTAAVVPALAELVGRVATGTAEIAFGIPAAARPGSIDRLAARWLGSAAGATHWSALAAAPASLARLPFARNDDGALFRCELAVQAALADLRTIAAVNSAWTPPAAAPFAAALAAIVTARAQSMHILYDRRFDIADIAPPPYELKVGYKTPHTVALASATPGMRVLDLGAADGYVARLLAERGCFVTAVDRAAPANNPGVAFVVHDLDRGPPDVDYSAFDLVLMLDVIEHLRDPEAFMDDLAARMGRTPGRRLLLSTGNVGFIVTRLMLLAGQFNYGRRGILDRTHTRLFTRGTIERLLRQSGFRIVARDAVPVPIPAALGQGTLARLLLAANGALVRLLPRLFAYQVIAIAEPAARFAALAPHEPDSRTEPSP